MIVFWLLYIYQKFFLFFFRLSSTMSRGFVYGHASNSVLFCLSIAHLVCFISPFNLKLFWCSASLLFAHKSPDIAGNVPHCYYIDDIGQPGASISRDEVDVLFSALRSRLTIFSASISLLLPCFHVFQLAVLQVPCHFGASRCVYAREVVTFYLCCVFLYIFFQWTNLFLSLLFQRHGSGHCSQFRSCSFGKSPISVINIVLSIVPYVAVSSLLVKTRFSPLLDLGRIYAFIFASSRSVVTVPLQISLFSSRYSATDSSITLSTTFVGLVSVVEAINSKYSASAFVATFWPLSFIGRLLTVPNFVSMAYSLTLHCLSYSIAQLDDAWNSFSSIPSFWTWIWHCGQII